MAENKDLGKTAPRALEILKRVPGGSRLLPVEMQGAPKPVERPKVPAVIESAPVVEESKEAASKGDEWEFDLDPVDKEAPVVEAQKEGASVETPPAPKEEPKTLMPEDLLPEDPTDEIDQMIDPKSNIKENFKKFRTKLKSLNQVNRDNAAELEALRKKVKDYDDGLAVPEITQKQAERIEELEKYEKLHNFKGSAVYQEKFAEPLARDVEAVNKLAEDYKIDPSVLHAAYGAKSEQETNKLLLNAFKDDVGALDAKSLFRSMKKTQAEARAAEADIENSFTRMQQENDQLLFQKRVKANEAIKRVSKDSWAESLIELRKDSRFKEIQYVEGDTEHNEKYVRPILTKASQEYGRTIKILAEHGLTELPRELAMKFARSDQLAHYSAVLLEEKNNLQQEVARLNKLVNDRGYGRRPGVNNTSAGATPSSNGTSSVSAGARVLARVMK